MYVKKKKRQFNKLKIAVFPNSIMLRPVLRNACIVVLIALYFTACALYSVLTHESTE